MITSESSTIVIGADLIPLDSIKAAAFLSDAKSKCV